MPTELVADKAIPHLAVQIDSPVGFEMLRRLQQERLIRNDPRVDEETFNILQRLVALDLVDAHYPRDNQDKPSLWAINGNGERVLRYIKEILSPRLYVHPRAEPGLNSLSPEDRYATLAALDALRIREPASWSPGQVVLLDESKRLYLLRINADMRAFITILDRGDIELTDVVREETLRLFQEQLQDADGRK